VGYNGRVLKKIHLHNFKLHDDTSIEASRITVFIGPNNSGKSSIFQALLLVRQAALRNDRFLCQPYAGYQPQAFEPYQYSPQMSIDLGSFEEITHRTGEPFDLQFSGEVYPPQTLHLGPGSVTVELGVKDNQLLFHDGTIDVSGFQGTWEFVPGRQPKSTTLQLDKASFYLQVAATFQLTGPGGYKSVGPQLGYEESLHYNEVSQWLGSLPVNLLRSVHPVYPLRGFEEWGYPITGFPPESLELMTLHDRALALPNAMAADRRLRERLNAQLEELLHVTIDFETVTGKRLKIWTKPSDSEGRATLYVNQGTGASQIPFILVPTLLTPPNETIVLSEPEAHLHPKGQSELTALLLTVAHKQGFQFFIETHSEHVLHRLLHAVAKGELPHDDLAIYYFPEPKEGKADPRKLKIDEKGGVEGGLPGFFDQSLDELAEYLEALKQPKA